MLLLADDYVSSEYLIRRKAFRWWSRVSPFRWVTDSDSPLTSLYAVQLHFERSFRLGNAPVNLRHLSGPWLA